MNLAQFLRASANRLGAHPGFACGGKRWSWSELDARVDAIAHALTLAGITKGDCILVQSKNGLELLETMFVCFRLGAVWVPANFRQTPEELAYAATASGAVAMFCQGEFQRHAEAVQAAVALKLLVTIGPADFGVSYDALLSRHQGQRFPQADVERDDPCWFFFTSGTTGRPKAAVLTHGQMGFVVTNHLADLMPGMTPEQDVSLIVAPLSHGAGIHALVQVARGVTSILPERERLDAEEIWQLVARWRVTNVFTVPTIVKMLVEHPAVDRYDHSSLKHLVYAGAPMYREDQRRALEKLGPVLVQYFGLGEVTGNITVLPSYLHHQSDTECRQGTCGYARTGMQISIQNDDGQELQPYEPGEICVCGLAVFAGYHNNPEANAKAFRNGWFRTGDLGHLDEQGFLYITGRASDMYISGGSNIYPREIEEKLLAHPAVSEVAVLGIPDPHWGEIGVAIVVAHQQDAVSAQALAEWMQDKIARYKIPRYIFLSDHIPKTPYGKISKQELRTFVMESYLSGS